MCPCVVYPGYRTLTQDEEDFDKFLESVKAHDQQLSLATKGITSTDFYDYSSIDNVSTYILYTVPVHVLCGVPLIYHS